ncbi:DUF445 family protein [Saprospira sp. CCB-QB6]|uniref:DUF445 domain-containing protein n=1 Tax=Saprospira sp. CCB-QB6 TaxID=3023936 RepID=UPI0023499CCB|nr:DUF445 family protein [Saprospira sp. CCB-QB6]WCL81665.1 DUF445 family protein [Saprospira sp. CCB-QB6]
MMEYLNIILDFFQVFYVDRFSFWALLIPVISAVVGWGTNKLALKMTFYPLEFVGWTTKNGHPILGWQGIIPSKGVSMADTSVDMITDKLIDVEEQFDRINPRVIAKEMEPRMLDLTREIINEAMREELPLWKLLPEKQKAAVFERAAREIPKVTEEIMQEVKDNITEIFNLKQMTINHLSNNKELMNRMFLDVGDKEFKFIEYSGLYFGFLFGIAQMLIWIPFGAWWQLPLGGLVVGYLTNVLALNMIFKPAKAYKLFGWKIQGLFILRQKEVAKEYANIVANEIITMPNIFRAMFEGDASDRLLHIIEQHVNESFDQTAGFSSALIRITSGSDSYDRIKEIACRRLVAEVPEHIHLIFDYAQQALDIEHTLSDKMSSLPPEEFVDFLRPVFQQDEWKLLLVGSILGMAAGFLQILTV